MVNAPRHGRGRLDVRPLDPFSSIKIKLGVLVTATVTLGVLVTWIGLRNFLGPRWTLPLAVLVSLVAVQILARGMTSPLREMTAAARAMAAGDYSRRVTQSSRDEVGQLARAFNTMAEDLEQADTLRRELVANVSHELRTPVAALQAQLENMVDGVSPADPETLNAALAQTERLGRLVTDLLDLSRLEAGAVALDIAPVEVATLCDEAVAAARLVAPSKGLTFEVDVEPADLAVPADSQRLHQVLANLLQNAVRHSPRGGVVRVMGAREGRDVVLDVIDQGPGIPKEDRTRVFERFTRGNVPAITGQISTGGTGLGLAIARWAVTLHGGTIEVADSARGCDMRVRLPAEVALRSRG
ncbi:ATP-binding protein [Actinotalea sp. M2MS4P-6]|uniref:HAMP domain-containing sensor histidine kinase n=1 Tax=Actinotalea sp. M2MS4P-6 TaxID=2983762 RepID=UPI0021E488D6|nr:ATP-binding protein [Actinotalea sp. M2MS4P-6]MCV2394117.1 ATP-binding protein [Actinotalea sp. M2MS4P-6]